MRAILTHQQVLERSNKVHNPDVFEPDDVNTRAHKTFGQFYQATLEREQLIKRNGYRVISIWEADFKLSQKNANAQKTTYLQEDTPALGSARNH